MSLRFRRRLRLFPGVSLNLSKQGLSSISFGGPGASINVPVARSGGTRSTVGLPGTGLSWTSEGTGPRSVRQRQQQQRVAPQTTSTEHLIDEVMSTMCGPNHVGDALWRQGLVEHVLDHADTPRAIREAALMVKSPEMVELIMRRAKGKAATVSAGHKVIKAGLTVIEWAQEQGWAEVSE